MRRRSGSTSVSAVPRASRSSTRRPARRTSTARSRSRVCGTWPRRAPCDLGSDGGRPSVDPRANPKARRRKPPGLLHAPSEVARWFSSPRCSKLATTVGEALWPPWFFWRASVRGGTDRSRLGAAGGDVAGDGGDRASTHARIRRPGGESRRAFFMPVVRSPGGPPRRAVPISRRRGRRPDGPRGSTAQPPCAGERTGFARARREGEVAAAAVEGACVAALVRRCRDGGGRGGMGEGKREGRGDKGGWLCGFPEQTPGEGRNVARQPRVPSDERGGRGIGRMRTREVSGWTGYPTST